MDKLLATLVVGLALLAGMDRAQAQDSAAAASPAPQATTPDGYVKAPPLTDEELDLLRSDIRSMRKQLIAKNLKLSDEQGAAFWPVYEEYAAELSKVADHKADLMKRYSEQWGTMTDDQALEFAKGWLAADVALTKLRESYIGAVSKTLNGRTLATFFQLDRRITMMVDLQLSSQMPLVQKQDAK
ncbi:MAG TPA: hypothetical protein VFL14_12480 [Xanthomonadales bacterium]|nr:hypothetical protein [Xanthomonadales bacterium]